MVKLQEEKKKKNNMRNVLMFCQVLRYISDVPLGVNVSWGEALGVECRIGSPQKSTCVKIFSPVK